MIGDQTCEHVGQQHKKPHCEHDPQYDGKRHEDVHGIDLQLFCDLLVRLRRLREIAVDLGGAHDEPRARHKLRDEIDHPPHKGQSEKYIALFGALEEPDATFYLVNMEKQTWMKLDLPEEMRRDGVDIHLVGDRGKMLLMNYDEAKAYLVDISSL